jgi:hypothetical protein
VIRRTTSSRLKTTGTVRGTNAGFIFAIETKTPPEGGAIVVAVVAGVYLKLAVPLGRTSP